MSPVDSLRTETKFKKTEIGEIPVDWDLVKLEEFCEVLGGSTPSTKKPEYWNGDISWAVPTDITKLRGNVIENTEKKISEGGLRNSAAKMLPAGSILLTSRATIGECAINSKPMATNQGFANLVCKSNVHNWFLFYRIKFIKKELESLSSGSTFREISKRSIREIKIPLPPFVEQKKIADILITVDKAIEKRQEIIEETKELKKGVMQELLTRGIGHAKFKKTEIGEIPEEWKIVSIIEILKKGSKSIRIGPSGSQLKKEYLAHSGYKAYGQENVFKNDFTLGNRRINRNRFEILSSFQLFPGDVVITMMGTIGKCAIVPEEIEPGIMDSHLLRLEIDENKYSKEMMVQLISESPIIKKQIKQLSVGGIMEGLSSGIVKKMIFPYPPIQEQKSIAKYLSAIDDNIEEDISQKHKLEFVKKGLMNELLTGKKRVIK